MTAARAIIHSLDNTAGRRILARYASWHASRASGESIKVFYDGVWLHRIGDRHWADSHQFVYHRAMSTKWLSHALQQDDMARDFWFHVCRPRPGDTIVDIGAGDGSDLPVISEAVGPQGRVIAVEAHPRTYELLQKAVQWNRLQNVECVQMATSDKPGRVHISDCAEHISNAIGADGADDVGIGGFDVESCTIDGLCDEVGIGQIDFLKMNIEGAERHAIRGMTSVMARVRYLCIACHDFRAERGEGEQFRTKAAVVAFLCDNGWQVVTRDAHPDPSVRDHIHAWNPTRMDRAGHGASEFARSAHLKEKRA